MQRTVALVTPTHRNDIERFALLSDSVDRYLSGFEKHYVVVNDDDLQVFAPFARHARVIVPCSQLLPRWLKLLPSIRRKGRRIWCSLLTRPVHGWHIQQILKIAAALRFPEQRYCLLDSDNVFFRPFDIKSYAGAEKAPLYIDYAAIAADAPLHAAWTRNCDRLLGHDRPTSFPADDYVGNAIVWDQPTLRDMTQTIERGCGKSWPHALCSTRNFSEYLLYGHFVRQSPAHLAAHRITTVSLANAYWDEAPLDAAAVAALVDNADPAQVALCVQSYSHTPIAVIRDVLGLQKRDLSAAGREVSAAVSARKLDAQLRHG